MIHSPTKIFKSMNLSVKKIAVIIIVVVIIIIAFVFGSYYYDKRKANDFITDYMNATMNADIVGNYDLMSLQNYFIDESALIKAIKNRTIVIPYYACSLSNSDIEYEVQDFDRGQSNIIVEVNCGDEIKKITIKLEKIRGSYKIKVIEMVQ